MPHWNPPSSMNASCSGDASPSTVRTAVPSTCVASSRHADIGAPSTCTAHRPQTPTEQPFFVPVLPRSSRRRSTSSRSAETITSTGASFSVKLIRCWLTLAPRLEVPAPLELVRHDKADGRDLRIHLGDVIRPHLPVRTFLQSPLDVPLVTRRFRATEHVEPDDVPLVDRALRGRSAFGCLHHLLKLLLAVRD